VRKAADRWSQKSFKMQHYFQLIGDTEISLYSGSGQAALEHLEGRWQSLKRSLLRRIQLFRIESHHVRGRCVLAAAEGKNLSASSRRRLLREADRVGARIRRERTEWGSALATLLSAGAASLRGRGRDALASLSVAEAGFDAAQMALYAAATRRCRGLLLGGEEGCALVESADAWMRNERIKNPERMTAMLAPGRWTAD
jgi:hypothetical protein